MSSSAKLAGIILATLIIGVVPAFGTAITPNGTWYNFWNLDGNNFAINGSSCTLGNTGCTEGYSAPGDPPWTFTIPITMQGLFVITDGGHQGDVFSVFNNGALLGNTPTVVTNTSHDCGGFPTACLADPAMSHTSFVLPSGSYSITIKEDNFFEPSNLAWFKVTESAAVVGTTPEPGTFALIGSALLAVSCIRRRKRA